MQQLEKSQSATTRKIPVSNDSRQDATDTVKDLSPNLTIEDIQNDDAVEADGTSILDSFDVSISEVISKFIDSHDLHSIDFLALHELRCAMSRTYDELITSKPHIYACVAAYMEGQSFVDSLYASAQQIRDGK